MESKLSKTISYTESTGFYFQYIKKLFVSWHNLFYVKVCAYTDSRVLAFLKQIAVHSSSPSTYFIQTFAVLNAKGQSPYKSCIV